MNDQERLAFAVKFAQTDFPSIREGDWLNLIEDFAAFLMPSQTMAMSVRHDNPGETVLDSRPQAEALQKKAYALLSDLVDIRDGRKKRSDRWPINFDILVQPPIIEGSRTRYYLCAQGKEHDIFLLRVFLLLIREPTNRVLRCDAADCDRIFYRVRKQKFCSQRCQSRDFMRRFRNPDEESERNHKRYENRMKKKLGQKTRVARRPRRASHARKI
jgi:hypothetical protein